MTPALCRVKHQPPTSYGDCVRACVATVMDLDTEQVPHFVHDGCNGEVMQNRIREWLALHKYVPFWAHYPGEANLEEVLSIVGDQNPGVPYLLYGHTGEGDHVVVCVGSEIVHNPAWYRIALRTCASWGTWSVMVIARK